MTAVIARTIESIDRSALMTIDPSRTVADLAVSLPHATRIFARFGIDFCCGGKRPLSDACARVGASLDEVVRSLETESREGGPSGPELAKKPLGELVRHVLDHHHVFTREELGRLGALAQKVATVHGGGHAHLATLRDLVRDLDEDLRPHMMKEEHILYPYVLALAGGARPQSPFGEVSRPIGVMNAEHESTGEILRKIRECAGGFDVPSEACGSWRALYEGLRALESDLFEHIHLETNVIFPRAIETEKALRA